MPNYYVDNALNRRLGRVGKLHGTAVHSSSGSSSSGRYVDNAMNRRLGRVGMPLGSAVHSSSGSSSSGRYVDNALNRRLGRVGMPLGSAVHSRSSGTTSLGLNFHYDNPLSEILGPVGMMRSSAVLPESETSSSSSSSSSSGVSVDNPVSLPLEPMIRSKISQSSYSSPSTYVDNELNRRLGRVGLERGTAVYSKSTNTLTIKTTPRTYVDNALNRGLARVGKPLGSCPLSTSKYNPKAFDFNAGDWSAQEEETDKDYPDYVYEEVEYLKKLKAVRGDATAKRTTKVELKPEKIIAFDELALGSKIGIGGFADVHIATWRNQQVAVKKLRVQRVHQAKKKQFEDEVRSFTDLDHPTIVKFYGACIVTPNLALVMEFLPDGSLYDNLYYSEQVQFDDETKNQFVSDSFTALKYIHSKNMVHRDIKSKNIMLCNEKTRCKLADFGLALKDDIETNFSSTQSGFAGTVKYCPKEVLEGNRLTIDELKSVDVYSLALTTFELLTEKEPFSEFRNVHQIRRAIIDGEILKTLTTKEYGISTAKKGLLKSALSVSPNRPSAADFLKRFDQIIAAEN